MKQTDRIAQLENEIRALKAQKDDSTFRAIFDYSADGMMLADSAGLIKEWNNGHERLTGLDKESVVGKMSIWEVSELLFSFEKQTRDELENLQAIQRELVANMQEKTLVRYIKHRKTGEIKALNMHYFPVSVSDERMLGAICHDVSEEIKYREKVEEMNTYQTQIEWILAEKTSELILEYDRLQAIGDNFPDGSLFRFEINPLTKEMNFTYLSATWEKVTGLSKEESIADLSNVTAMVFPEYLPQIRKEIESCMHSLEHFLVEIRFRKGEEIRWMQMSSNPRMMADYKIIFDGFLLDITARKEAEAELANYRENLESLVQERTYELESANLEMKATSEELQATSEELHASNEELSKYQLHLEDMVDEKSQEITAQKVHLEKLNRSQDIIIKVLKIMQSAENISNAMNEMLAEIGKFTNVSRVYIFEKSDDGNYMTCTYEWCADGITRIIDKFQNSPVDLFQGWFDIFNTGQIINTSDINTLPPNITKILCRFGVKSFLDLPLSVNESTHYGFVGFDECINNRKWDEHEIELLQSFAQIVSATRQRFRAEHDLIMERDRLKAIGDNFPDGALFRWQINPKTKEMRYTYLSGTWTKITRLDYQRTLNDMMYSLSNILPEDRKMLLDKIYHSEATLENYSTEVRFFHPSAGISWLQIAASPRLVKQDLIVYDGFVLNINDRKIAEKNLENLSRRQNILVNVLQILQSAVDLPKAINMAIAETGKFTGVSRISVFEKNNNKTLINNTFGWCNEGIGSVINTLQNIPVENAKTWFDLINSGKHVCASDSKILAPEISKLLIENGVKSVVVFPLMNGSDNYGFIIFDECVTIRSWSEDEIELLKNISQIISDTRNRIKAEQELIMERDRLQTIGDNFPGGSLFRFEITPLNTKMCFTYLSATWEDVMGISIQDTLADASKATNLVAPEHFQPMMEKIEKCMKTLEHFFIEIKNHYKDGKTKWILISSHPKKMADDKVIFDGFVLDITRRKENEIELAQHRDQLEILVKKRTDELQAANNELQVFNDDLRVINEEMHATNEELSATSEELYATNEELEKYKAQLEDMVAEKTSEVVLRQRELRRLNRRQEIFIKVMQILQLEEDISKGMKMVLDIVGNYSRVSRVQVWENNPDGLTYGCSYEWCNKGVEPNIQFRQNLPMQYAQPWLDTLLADKIICTSDIYTLKPGIHKMLERDGVKSILVLPLSIFDLHFGFIAFQVCEEKAWEPKEVDLLTNISQIFSNVIRRRQVETAMNLSQQTMRTVLDNINANILVSEFDTYKILFANNSFRQEAGCNIDGMLCWQSRKDDGPCKHCRRPVLRDSEGRPTGVHYWEYHNPWNDRWYIMMGTAIKWVTGQLVIMELATDITDRKLNEIELMRAREKAEESDNLKSAFLANMSHEIRTPLNAIVGFLNIIAAENLSREREQDYFKIINNSAAQLVQLIDDIIDISKIEAKQMNFFPVPINVNHLMTELQIVFETILQTKNKSHIELILDDSGFVDNCVTIVDPMRLRQVLNNLIGNAVKYTEKGYIRFAYRQSAPDQLEFVVEDTGIGLPDGQHQIIFERFRQAETSKFHGGTGLGLNIALNLVQMMGGNIWVESAEGAGSLFYFTILYRPVQQINR